MISKKWIAILKDNSVVKEGDKPWHEIKDNISYLYMENNGQYIYPPKNAEHYEQSKTASATFGSNSINIESRNLTAKYGNTIMSIRISEKDNSILMEMKQVG